MANPFRALWYTLRDLFDEFFILIVSNLLWLAISLPAFFFAYTFLAAGSVPLAAMAALLGILPAGPATAGLSYLSYRVSDGRAVKVGDFFSGMRTYAQIGWLIVGVWVSGALIIVFNIGFYIGTQGLVGGLLLGLWAYALLSWLALLLYSFPLILLQEQPDPRTMLRNAAVMVLSHPVFTIVTVLLMLLILVLSTILVAPLVLISVALLNLWSMRATRYLIDVDEQRRTAAQARSGQPTPPNDEKGRKGQVRPK